MPGAGSIQSATSCVDYTATVMQRCGECSGQKNQNTGHMKIRPDWHFLQTFGSCSTSFVCGTGSLKCVSMNWNLGLNRGEKAVTFFEVQDMSSTDVTQATVWLIIPPKWKQHTRGGKKKGQILKSLSSGEDNRKAMRREQNWAGCRTPEQSRPPGSRVGLERDSHSNLQVLLRLALRRMWANAIQCWYNLVCSIREETRKMLH